MSFGEIDPTHEVSRRSKLRQWKPITDEEILKFFGIIMAMGVGTNTETKSLLEQQSVVWVENYLKYHVEREARTKIGCSS